MQTAEVPCSPVKSAYKEPSWTFCFQMIDQRHVLIYIWVKKSLLHLGKWEVVVILVLISKEREKLNHIIKAVDYIFR